jgi:hypothetical protein
MPLGAAVIAVLFASVLVVRGCLREDTKRFEYALFAELSGDPVMTGWFPPTFPKSAQHIKGEIHIDSNSFWAQFSMSDAARETLLKDASEVKDARVKEMGAIASRVSASFKTNQSTNFYQFSFMHPQTGSTVRANLAIDARRNLGLIWYSLK